MTTTPGLAPAPESGPTKRGRGRKILIVAAVLVAFVLGLIIGGAGNAAPALTPGAGVSAPPASVSAPAPTSAPVPAQIDAPIAPTPVADRINAAGTYRIVATATPSDPWTLAPGTYVTDGGYGYALITMTADGTVGDPGYRMVAVNGHTLLTIRKGDVGKYVALVGSATWTLTH